MSVIKLEGRLNMQKIQSSFKITLLLYAVVLILPFSFYFVYNSFKTIQEDTKIVRQSSWVAGVMGHSINASDKQTVEAIDKALKNIEHWTLNNSETELYIGAETLSNDFKKISNCWTTNKYDLSAANNKCYAQADNMALNIEKMVYLKQNKIINVFYLSLILAMGVLLLVIYLIRVYIHQQIQKHAIHDHDTGLFNKKYFLSELHSTFDSSVRHENPLSLIAVTLNGFTDKTYDKKAKRKMLKELGEVFISVTRNSDITSRYNEDHIVVLLPLTDKEHAHILESRLKEALENHNFSVTPTIDFKFATTEASWDETEETFIRRTL